MVKLKKRFGGLVAYISTILVPSKQWCMSILIGKVPIEGITAFLNIKSEKLESVFKIVLLQH